MKAETERDFVSFVEARSHQRPSLDSALRDALADLADVPPPSGLAAAAIRTARRHRQVRVTVTGLAGVAAVLLAVPVTVSSVGGHPAGSATMEPLVVTAYSIALSGSLLLDPDTGDYLELPYTSVAPSPDGTYALVSSDDGSLGSERVGVHETATGEVRWIEGYVGAAGGSPGGWSPDGERLLVTQRDPERHGVPGPPGFVIVDPETLSETFVEHHDTEDPAINASGLRYVWAPSGTEIALTQSVGIAEAVTDVVTAIRFYDLAGNLTRSWPANAPLTSEAAFSPDGTRIALQDPDTAGPIQIVDAVTGARYRTLPAGSGDFVGWADQDHLIVRIFPYSRQDTLQIVTLAGEAVRAQPLRNSPAYAVYVGSSAGLTPDAAGLTFGVPR